MEDIVAIRYGMEKAHDVNEAWFAEINVNRSYPFNMLTSRRLLSFLGSLNQGLGFIYSLFLPNARIYLLTSTGCMPAVILKKWLLGSKVVVINSDTFYSDLNQARGIRRIYMIWLVSYVDGMISTSKMMKKLARKFFRGAHRIVYPFCNVNKFSNVKADYASLDWCAIGTGINTKGIDILFDAFELYRKEFPESCLFLCGSTRLIKGVRVPEGVETKGVVDPAIYLRKAGVYVNASRHESFGVSIIEAMCAGVVPVVTKNCGAAEVVRKVSSSLVVHVNAKSILRGVKMLTMAKRRRLSVVCRRVGKHFNKDRSVSEFKNAFLEVT